MAGCKQNSLCFKKVTPPGRKDYKIPTDVKTLLQRADSLSSENLEILTMELIKYDKLSDGQIIRVKNLLIGEQRRRNEGKNKENQGTHQGASGHLRTDDPRPVLRNQKNEEKPSCSGQPSTTDPSPASLSVKLKVEQKERLAKLENSGQQSTVDPGQSSNPRIFGLPVSNVPLIVRSDLAAVADVFALDTEKLISNTHEPVSGDVALVYLRGRLIFWAFIKHNPETICRFNEKQTGLNRTKIENWIELNVVSY